MKILAISDLHGDFRLAGIACAELRPDLLLCCGDWGDAGPDQEKAFAKFLALCPVLTVFGNHDSLELLASLRNQDGSPVLLAQGVVRVINDLRVAGISGIWAKSHRLPHYVTDDDVKEWSSQIALRGPIDILLTHACPVGLADLTPVPNLSINVLGPIIEGQSGQYRLRTFEGNVGKTKNGHSIILLLRYKNIRILLGGDLNIPSEKFLLEHYAQENTRDPFQAEVLKAYHHGSGDFSEEFVGSISPYVSVISSGDNESYSHPRADTMGFLGKASRGKRPLLFSTELARSAVEVVKNPMVLKQELKGLKDTLARTDVTGAEREKSLARWEELENKLINRSIAVYGAINLRSDGDKLLMCQKKEAKNAQREEWDIYQIEPDPRTNELVLVSKGGDGD